jgi:predicted DCC family thiol-disulfide oxidoreductase YuxK
MKRTQQLLHDFWFEAAPPARLAMLRILLGLYAIWYVGTEQDDLVKVVQTDPRLWAPVGIIFGGPPPLELFHWIARGTLLGAVFFTFGLWYRITGPVFSVMLLWLLCFRNSWSMIYHSDNLLVLHMIVLGLTRAADAFSLDAFLRGLRQPGRAATPEASWQYGWPIKLMIGLTVSAYFVTAVAKLAGPLGLGWASGQALRSQVAVDRLRKELLGEPPNELFYAMYDWVPVFTLLAAGSLMLEFFAPVALLNKRAGRLWAASFFLVHWGIFFVMGIRFRYQLSSAMFLPFFPVEHLGYWVCRLGRKLLKRAPAGSEEPATEANPIAAPQPGASRATLFYDGECGLCDRFVQFVLRHDRREYFQFATLQSDIGREQLASLGLSQTDLRTVVLAEAGKSYDRSTATLRVCRRLSGMWPLLYGFIVIPKPWRDAAYAVVARNRKRWFKSTPECPVMPPHWRRRFIS